MLYGRYDKPCFPVYILTLYITYILTAAVYTVLSVISKHKILIFSKLYLLCGNAYIRNLACLILFLDPFPIDKNTILDNLDRLAREPNDPFDIIVRILITSRLKHNYIPAPRPHRIIDDPIDQNGISIT